MIEEVQTRTQAQIHDACEPDTPVLIEAPPASGKTYSAVRLAAAGHKVLYLAGRTALYEQARAEVEELTAEHGEEISVETIPSPNRNCPTFQGKNSGNTERFKRLYARGMTAKQIHLQSSPDSMPCHTKDSDCEYMTKRSRLRNEVDSTDIVIGNHQHAYSDHYFSGRVVILDEFNATPFLQRFPSERAATDSPAAVISTFLEAVDAIPLESFTDVIEARVRQGAAYTTTMEWFHDHGAGKDTAKEILDISASPYHASHAQAGMLTYSVLTMEQLGPKMELAADPSQWEAVDVTPTVRCVRDRRSGEMLLLEPPAKLADAEQVIGLDAIPVTRLWEVVYGCRFDKETVVPRRRLDQYLQTGLNMEVIQVTTNRNPYSSGNISIRDRQRFALARNLEGRPFPVIARKQALAAYRSRPWFEDCVESTADGTDDYRVHNYGSVLSSNRFQDESVGFISGNPYPGDHVVTQWCALCGESTRPTRTSDGEHTELSFDTALGDRIYRHFTHDQVFQAMLRFGRSPSDSSPPSTVYVNTSTVPAWLSPTVMQIDDFHNAPKRVVVVETLINAVDAADRQDWQTIATIHEAASTHLGRTRRKPTRLDKEWVRKVLQDPRLQECIDRAPNRGRNGADLYKWDGEAALQPTVGIVSPADHLLVTGSYAMFLRLDRETQT